MEGPPVTFRRVMLVLLPLLAVGFVFTVMWYLYQDWERSLVGQRRPEVGAGDDMPTGHVEMETLGGASHVVSTNVNLVRKDKAGRTEMQFLADRVEHLEENTAEIQRPQLQFFTKRGEIITLLAETGHIVTRGALIELDDIESGRLWGNVVLVHDRGTPDDYADDILMGIDDIAFDNEAYHLATDGPVLLVGPEMTLSATRMRVTLDRETRRVNTMTFFQDICITFEGGQRLRLGLTPRADDEAPEAGVPGTPAAASDDTADTPTADADDSTDLWRIDLAGDVDARQDDQRLRCDRLRLYNRTAAGMEDDQGSAMPAPAQPASPPPDAGSPDAPADADDASTFPSLMMVVADGPLIITPVDEEERRQLGDHQYEVYAEGRPVLARDGETHIVSHTVRYNTRTGIGSIAGQDTPMLLEQPGRVRVTGGRLDFNQTTATAEISGEGSLRATVSAATLTGVAPPAETPDAPADEDTDLLEASWQRSLRLRFYRLSADAAQGAAEIKQANFLGRAVVKQGDGLLKGNDLTVDFLPSQGDQGQAVRRLVGHGNVLLKNAPVTGTGAGVGPAADVGDIACQDLDIHFARDPDGTTRPTSLKASGDVAINDPKGKIRAEDLAVTFAPSADGETEARFLEARGNVLIDREDLVAEGSHIRRDTDNGTLLLEGTPARARHNKSRIVGNVIRFSESEGRATVTGAGELEVPATTDLRGRPRETPEPLLVRWSKDMHFSDDQNFARFSGDVLAITGGTELTCTRLWVTFVDEPETTTPADDGAPTADAAPVEAAPEPDEAEPAADNDLQKLFGRKRLVRVLAEKNVLAVDQRLDEDQAVRHRLEITADNLTYLAANRKAYVHGPGQVRILARDRGGQDAVLPTPLTSKTVQTAWDADVPPGYARTAVTWTDSMAYDGLDNRAYFVGRAEAIHAGRGVPGEGDRTNRRPTTARIVSRDLQVVFGERDAVDGPPEPREERLSVEKLIARGDVLLWVGDRRGAGDRLIYQRDPELIRLYRGAGPDQWARLWREDEATQEFGQIAARTITFEPSTGRVDVVDQQVITISPKPRPTPPPRPRLVPGVIE